MPTSCKTYDLLSRLTRRSSGFSSSSHPASNADTATAAAVAGPKENILCGACCDRNDARVLFLLLKLEELELELALKVLGLNNELLFQEGLEVLFSKSSSIIKEPLSTWLAIKA